MKAPLVKKDVLRYAQPTNDSGELDVGFHTMASMACGNAAAVLSDMASKLDALPVAEGPMSEERQHRINQGDFHDE